ncbi:nickel ABC transporter ATP-binding protein NikE [Mycetocola saprophilus]
MSAPLLEVDNLRIGFAQGTPVDGVSLRIGAGEYVALVGETGSGKTLTALAIMGLLPGSARVSGTVTLDGHPLPVTDDAAMSRLRGKRIAMIFQDPLLALNPVRGVANQIREAIRIHAPTLSRARVTRRVAELLSLVDIEPTVQNLRAYPHEYSGGMRQRAMIAMAIAHDPALLIADEPTTALDMTVQAHILEVLRRVRERTGTAILLVTHDLGIVSAEATRTVVMRAGRVRESADTAAIFSAPSDPYTSALVTASARFAWGGQHPQDTATDNPDAANPAGTLLSVRDLHVRYPRTRGSGGVPVHAVRGVSLALNRGQTLALVGESGSGKTSTARAILQLTAPGSGTITIEGRDVASLSRRERARLRPDVQMVFQDASGALDPRMSVDQLIAEALPRGSDQRTRTRHVGTLLSRVELSTSLLTKSAHELSGGQRQRVQLARALAASPRLLVLDEPLSALDVGVRGEVLDLLISLQQATGVGYLLIAHDLATVREIADRTAVMYRGEIVESGPTAAVLGRPQHPYTRTLIGAIPRSPSFTADLSTVGDSEPAPRDGGGPGPNESVSPRLPSDPTRRDEHRD